MGSDCNKYGFLFQTSSHFNCNRRAKKISQSISLASTTPPKNLNMKAFTALAIIIALSASAFAAPAPADKDGIDVAAPKIPKALEKKLNRIAKAAKAVREEAASSDNDDVVAVINDIVNVLNTINGMNSIGQDSVDVVNTLTGFGEIDVVAGNEGETVKVQVGDLTNVIGKLQGTWFTNDVVANDVAIDSNNEAPDTEDAQVIVDNVMKALNRSLKLSSSL